MSAVLLGTYPVGSDEWHAARAKGLGGSEIAAVLGLSKWSSRYSLWMRKAGILTEPVKLTSPMVVGNYVEPALQQWWEDRHSGSILERNPGTYAHKDRAWQVASPDGLIYGKTLRDQAILECKFAVYDYEWGAEGTDEIPPYYLTQCRWYLDVFGLDVCHVAVLFGGSGRFAEYVVRKDEADAQLMRYEAKRFLEELAAGTRPSIDDHGATYEAIRAEHPEIDREMSVELDADLYEKYLTTKEEAETAAQIHRGVKSRVLDQMGDARYARVGETDVLRRQPGQGGSVALYTVKPPKEKAA